MNRYHRKFYFHLLLPIHFPFTPHAQKLYLFPTYLSSQGFFMQIQANAAMYSYFLFLTTAKYFTNGTVIAYMLIRHVYVACHQ